uniref:Uncharacterized protein n=1 Tax=Anguilla anguilla TaxID=7936 RepID=A0A0E9W5P5_ANGAN
MTSFLKHRCTQDQLQQKTPPLSISNSNDLN